MATDIPFVHSVVPSYYRTSSGLEVPCDGPHLLALDDDDLPICSRCKQRVYHAGTDAVAHVDAIQTRGQ